MPSLQPARYLLVGLVLASLGLTAQARKTTPADCNGTYANDLSRASAPARKVEAQTRYTFCLRSSVTYDCIHFGPKGRVRHRKESSTAHGTAFVYRTAGTHAYLLTNEHVTEWPFVTSAEEKVDGIPTGCKRVSQTLAIVDNEDDSYTQDDIALQRVVADKELDVAVLKGPLRAKVVPFTLGQSSGLRTGNAVQVRGFPLGAFQTVTLGKVINPRDHDTENNWDHYDFVIDAPLSTGNSGSPVLAVNCRTGQLELVGIYHAAYRDGQSLNVVVGIDDFREVMITLKPRRKPTGAPVALTAADRKRLFGELGKGSVTPLFPFGGQTIGVRHAGDRLLFDVYSKSFPLLDWRLAVIEDLPAPGFGRIGRLWFGGEQGLREQVFSALDADEQVRITTLVTALRQQLFRVVRYRRYEQEARGSRAAYDQLRALKRVMERQEAEQRQLMRALAESAPRFAPGPGERGQAVEVTTHPPRPAATR